MLCLSFRYECCIYGTDIFAYMPCFIYNSVYEIFVIIATLARQDGSRPPYRAGLYASFCDVSNANIYSLLYITPLKTCPLINIKLCICNVYTVLPVHNTPPMYKNNSYMRYYLRSIDYIRISLLVPILSYVYILVVLQQKTSLQLQLVLKFYLSLACAQCNKCIV